MSAAPQRARPHDPWHTHCVVDRDADAANVRIPPPLIYAAAVVAGVALHRLLVPLALPLSPIIRLVVASVTGAVGLVLLVAAMRAFRRTGQDPKPWKTSPEFIASGVYRWSRNPMYAGMASLQVSLALGLANGWLLVFVPAVLGVIYVTAVRQEEAYLEEKFGASYRTFKTKVRRWL